MSIVLNDIVTVIKQSQPARPDWPYIHTLGSIGFVAKIRSGTVDMQYIGRDTEHSSDRAAGKRILTENVRKSTANEISNIMLRVASGLTTGLDTVPVEGDVVVATPLGGGVGGGGRKSKRKKRRRKSKSKSKRR